MPKRLPLNARTISLVVKEIDKMAIERMHKLALRVHARLVAATPVDLGQARAGWNFSINDIDRTKPPRPPKGQTIPAPDTPSGVKAKKGSDVYNISNLVEHVIYLNEGHSKQAPSKFIEQEIAAAARDVS